MANKDDYSTLTSVVIPDGVEEISAGQFENCATLTSVVIPDSVKKIGDRAFAGCSALKTVVIPDGVALIGAGSFQGCSSLMEIFIPGSVKKIRRRAFADCSSLLSVVLADGVKIIDIYAFLRCVSLRRVVISRSVMEIGDLAFWGCSLLTRVFIPKGVRHIGIVPFDRNTTLEVDPRNVEYCSEDGALFDKDKTIILFLSNRESYKIPDGVNKVNAYTFWGCSSLKRVFIPASVRDVKECAFDRNVSVEVDPRNEFYSSEDGVLVSKYYPSDDFRDFKNPSSLDQHFPCESLEAIFSPDQHSSYEIPGEVSKIGRYAFYDCLSLKSVYIHRDVIMIDEYAFNHETRIDVDPRNDRYCSEDGTLFDKDKKTILFLPNQYTSYEVPHGVTIIGARAFSECSSLTKVVIPEGVEKIYLSAFDNCASLKSVVLPATVKIINVDRTKGRLHDYEVLSTLRGRACIVFERQTVIDVDPRNKFYSSEDGVLFDKSKRTIRFVPNGRSEYTVPEGVESIDEKAFLGCSTLTSVVIPEGVSVIAGEAFADCVSLKSLTLPRSVQLYYWPFVGDYIPKVNGDHFYNCESLESVNFLGCATEIFGYGTFTNTSLTSIVIPDGVKTIESCAFSRCSSLVSVVVPSSVETINPLAFSDCISLTSVLLSEGVKRIETFAFSSCVSLATLKIPASVEYIDGSAFSRNTILEVDSQNPRFVSEDGALFDKKKTKILYCPNIRPEYVIPKGVIVVGAQAFEYCDTLRKVVIPEGVKEIDYAAFKGCSSLTEVVLPEGLMSIGENAFEDCASLARVVLPKGLEKIGIHAFEGCVSLKRLVVPVSLKGSMKYTCFDGQLLYEIDDSLFDE